MKQTNFGSNFELVYHQNFISESAARLSKKQQILWKIGAKIENFKCDSAFSKTYM